MESEELLEVVDEHNRVVGRAPRHEVHGKSLMHRSAHIFLFNSRGELFLQKRSENKDRFPLHYDSSAAGHLSVGEEYAECAGRELEEELGIGDVPLVEVAHFKACQDTGWEHVSLYLCHTDAPVSINQAEVAEGGFYTLEEVVARVEENPSTFTAPFRLIFNWFIHNKDSFQEFIKGVR